MTDDNHETEERRAMTTTVGNVTLDDVTVERIGPWVRVNDSQITSWVPATAWRQALDQLERETFTATEDRSAEEVAYETLWDVVGELESNGPRTEIKVEADGYEATVSAPRNGEGPYLKVSISEGQVWSGDGTWDHHGYEIADCAAILGGTQDRADEIYDALGTAISDELDAAEARS